MMLKTILNVTTKHLSDIKEWLIDERNKTNDGFYSHWEIISKAFIDKRLIVITKNDYAIGFIVYTNYDLIAVIDIAEIKPNERKKGYAKKMISDTLEFFKSKDILAVRLFCSPENSESFWKRIGFLSFPVIPYDFKINMYKNLVETLNPSQTKNNESTIKLWNCEPHQTNGIKPNWIWDLHFLEDNTTLVKPIIFPAYKDWQVELTIGKQKVMNGMLKRLPIDLVFYNSLIIIQKIIV